MPRIKIQLPEKFQFSCNIPVRITDLNYGGHVGNDTVLSIIHEARMQFFRSLGYTEMDLGGCGLIMADAGIEFKAELFYGDQVLASVAVAEITRAGFDLYYKLETEKEGNRIAVAFARTGMICYDYERKKIVGIPVLVSDAFRKISS